MSGRAAVALVRLIRFPVLAAGALAALLAGACEEDDGLLRGDYAACGSAVLPAQEAVCDDLLTGVVRVCGFDLTVDACACAGEVEGCTADTAWLSIMTSCRKNASDCAEYVSCLEGMGSSPSGCPDPASWSCITSGAETGGE